ncbi:MAG: ExbD/TolR family protein [Sphingomonadales bacterium]
MAGGLLDPPGFEEGGGYKPLAEINVTPLVDVMLVLLIIFMITAPLMLSNVPLELPKLTAENVDRPEEPLVVSLDKDGRIFLKDEELTADELRARLVALAPARGGDVIFVRGDKGVDYGSVMDLLGKVGEAGFAKISLIAERPAGQ